MIYRYAKRGRRPKSQPSCISPEVVGLTHVLVEEALHLVERNSFRIVVQVDMAGARDDAQMLVVASQSLECVFAEIA